MTFLKHSLASFKTPSSVAQKYRARFPVNVWAVFAEAEIPFREDETLDACVGGFIGKLNDARHEIVLTAVINETDPRINEFEKRLTGAYLLMHYIYNRMHINNRLYEVRDSEQARKFGYFADEHFRANKPVRDEAYQRAVTYLAPDDEWDNAVGKLNGQGSENFVESLMNYFGIPEDMVEWRRKWDQSTVQL